MMPKIDKKKESHYLDWLVLEKLSIEANLTPGFFFSDKVQLNNAQ